VQHTDISSFSVSFRSLAPACNQRTLEHGLWARMRWVGMVYWEWGWGWGYRMEEPVSTLPVCWQTKMSEIFFQLFLIGACSQACSNDRRQKSKIYSVLILPEMSSRSIPRLSGCQIARTNGQTDRRADTYGHIRTATLMHVYVTANWLSSF